MPVRSDFFCSHAESGFSTRMVIVLLIRHICNTSSSLFNNSFGESNRQLMRIRFEMVSGDELEENEAEAGTEGEAGVEEPEICGGPFLEEAADPADQ